MIVPDTKDWTWVARETCPECGFNGSEIEPTGVPGLLRENAAAWQLVLTGDADVRTRPRPDRWSALEYACHVRDVCKLYDQRLVLMLTEDGPRYPNWDQDATAVEERYNEQDPRAVAAELEDAAGRLAERFEEVSGPQWERTGFRSDGAEFTGDSFARYFIHDPIHHLYDVTGSS